jgi:hypothetical protein
MGQNNISVRLEKGEIPRTLTFVYGHEGRGFICFAHRPVVPGSRLASALKIEK